MKSNKNYFIIGGVIIGLILIWILFIGFGKDFGEGVKGRESIITESLSFEDENIQGKVIKNKLTNTATIDISYSINDTEEYIDFFGEPVTGVPFIVNLMCGIFATAFFNPEALKELQDEGNMTSEEGNLIDLLEGITIQSSSILFKDKETNEKIAECKATGGEWDDIEFIAYRDYSEVGSFLGIKIGENMEE